MTDLSTTVYCRAGRGVWWMSARLEKKDQKRISRGLGRVYIGLLGGRG
jgi:hypothetical protein